MENSVDSVTIHSNHQEPKTNKFLSALKICKRKQILMSPDREFGTKGNSIIQILCIEVIMLPPVYCQVKDSYYLQSDIIFVKAVWKRLAVDFLYNSRCYINFV